MRRDGSRFPAEATVSKVDVRGELLLAGFIRDVTDRQRQQDEREALVREQAARAEAERVAELVSGMQLLVDAALAHRTLDDILSDLVARVRAVLDADAAAIYLAEDSRRWRWRPRPAARSAARDRRAGAVRRGFRRPGRGRARADARPGPADRRAALPGAARAGDRLPDRPAAAGRGRGDRGARRGRRRAAPLHRRRREPAAPGGRPRGARHRPRARVRARAQDRRDAAAQPAAGAAAAAARAVGGGPLPARPPPRPRSAATGTTCSRPRAAASAW